MKYNNSPKAFIPLLLLCIICSSCNDMELAEKAYGRWESVNVIKEDGNKEKTYYEFSAVKGSFPGGSFKETTYFTETYENDMGQEYNEKYKSIIQGTWRIKAGDIYFTYDLSTLKVTFEGIRSQNMNKISEALTQSYIKIYGQSLIQESIEELKENLYDWYSENENNEDCYQNLKIKGDNMSFDAADGVINLIRIK